MEAAIDSRTVSLAIPSKPDYIVLARLALSAVCRLAPLTHEEVADLKLAITESATYLMGGEGVGEVPPPIRFTFELREDELRIVVEGAELPSVSDDERELSLALIRAAVDEHAQVAGGMTLTKKLDRGAE